MDETLKRNNYGEATHHYASGFPARDYFFSLNCFWFSNRGKYL